MSGGRFDYSTDRACQEVFGWELDPDYGEDGYKLSKKAAKLNPLEDVQISEIAFDVFCLLHSFDWYKSGDTSIEQYRADVRHFRDKWFTPTRSELDKRYVDETVEAAKEEIYKTLGFGDEE